MSGIVARICSLRSTLKGLFHQNKYINNPQVANAMVASSSCVMGRLRVARAMHWIRSQEDWIMAIVRVRGSLLLAAWMSVSVGMETFIHCSWIWALFRF